jgi:cytochrome c peroxidase
MRAPRATLTALLLTVLWLGASARAEEPVDRAALRADYVRPADIPFPDNNPYSTAKAKLGELLFFDPLLSGSGARSCASCHNPGLSWGDGLPRAVGELQKTMALRSPTLLDVAWVPILGWDGKFRDLENVAFTPITGPGNMNGKEAEIIARLEAIAAYRNAFAAAFEDGAISRRNIELALATYERTIVAAEAPFDRWVAGNESAIDEAAKRGFDLFNTKARCAECHSGWNFTDGAFYDIGTAEGADIGRGRLFPSSTKLQHAFKVPTLRDAVRRAPYMHDGSVKTLAEVIELYDRGGVDRPSRSELIGPLHLSAEEKADLIAFLETLTGDAAPSLVPVLPR